MYLRYYEEHALQARRHEEQRERATAIVLTVAGFLVSFATFAKLSHSSVVAAASVALLGVYGYLFAGKHYERNRLHTAILKRVRKEIEIMVESEGYAPIPLSKIRSEAEERHNNEFTWPFSHSRAPAARAWITRASLHHFWESIHVCVFFLGIGMIVAIYWPTDPTKDPPTKIHIVGWPESASTPLAASVPATP